MDLKRVAAAAVEAAFNPDGAAQQEHEPERKHGGMSSVRTVAAGAALALAARVAVKKGPSLLPKTLMPNVMPSFSEVTDRVRDVLADQGWFDDDEDEDDGDYEDEAELEEGEDEEDDDEPEDFVDDEEEPEDAEDEEEDGEPEDFVDDEEEPEDAEDEEEDEPEEDEDDEEPEDYYEPEDDEEHDVDPVARPPRPPRSSANSSAR